MIVLRQTLSTDDYRAAAAIHYRSYRWAKFQPWLASLFIIVFSYLFFTTRVKASAFLGIGYGVYGLFRKKFWIDRLVKSVATAKRFGTEIQVVIEDDVIKTSQGDDQSSMRLSSLIGYIRNSIGLLVYPQRNLFYFLKAEAFDSPSQIDELTALLESHGVERLPT